MEAPRNGSATQQKAGATASVAEDEASPGGCGDGEKGCHNNKHPQDTICILNPLGIARKMPEACPPGASISSLGEGNELFFITSP